MNKILASTLAGVSLLVFPILASAQSADQNSLIEALRRQIQQLQQQIEQLLHSPSTNVSSDDNAPEPAPICPQLHISRTLSLGMSGEDVRSLQNFLISQGFLAAGNNTGYFGSLTDAAVKAFQVREGIEPVGIVGPQTRAAIVAYCSKPDSAPWTTPITPVGPTTLGFIASPTSGAAPLTVTFSAQVSGSNTYSINYGDGTSAAMQSLDCAGGCNPFPIRASRTYSAPGTYIAKLYDNRTDCRDGLDCSVASVMITVSNSTAGFDPHLNLAASVSGNVATISITPVEVGYCSSNGSDQGSINWGDGSTLAAGGTPGYLWGLPCNGSNGVFTKTHTYSQSGTYTITVVLNGYTKVTTITVLNTSQGDVNFSASPTSGTAPLTVRFSVRAPGRDFYSINYGDGTSGTMHENPVTNGGVCTGDSCNPYLIESSHTYASAGTYTAKLFDNRADCRDGADCSVASGTITVSSGNAATHTIGTSASSTKPGFVTGSWSTTGSAASDDWIALVPAGTTWNSSQPTSQLWVWATSNSKTKNNATASSGSVSFSSAPQGQLQLVYYLNTKDAIGNYIEKARSNAFWAIYGDD